MVKYEITLDRCSMQHTTRELPQYQAAFLLTGFLKPMIVITAQVNSCSHGVHDRLGFQQEFNIDDLIPSNRFALYKI